MEIFNCDFEKISGNSPLTIDLGPTIDLQASHTKTEKQKKTSQNSH